MTALSASTARRAAIEPDPTLVPILMKTANGTVRADSGTIEHRAIGPMHAKNFKAAISPASGDTDRWGIISCRASSPGASKIARSSSYLRRTAPPCSGEVSRSTRDEPTAEFHPCRGQIRRSGAGPRITTEGC
ncbi:retropepsin-like aspartic protease [Sphingopyxis sp. PAMC25046]|uniref:retropepsin-like aspartic protease n=1 Tax=Sphingopyxis sp. PAMC25046 TaxID=2565556 RepID=UPI001FFB16BC|nr:retropepsin-like aspartic protease [Sphingopyxis sp. PAMC25046]